VRRSISLILYLHKKTLKLLSIKVDSNCSAVFISVNGTPYQATTANDQKFLLKNVILKECKNIIKAIGMDNGKGRREKITINNTPVN